MRPVLVDSDGTLLTARGAGRRAPGRALDRVHAITGPIARDAFRGRMDPGIVCDSFADAEGWGAKRP